MPDKSHLGVTGGTKTHGVGRMSKLQHVRIFNVFALGLLSYASLLSAQIITGEITGYDEKTVWSALYEADPWGRTPVNYVAKLTFDNEVLAAMKEGYAFLHSIKVIESPEMPKNAINPEPLAKAMKEMGVKAPLGEIRGQPASAYKN